MIDQREIDQREIDERELPQREDQLVETGRIEHFFESLLFVRRPLVLAFFLIATVLLGWQASQLRPDASFEKMIPVEHPFVENYLENKADLAALSNSVRIILATSEGDIFDAEFQDRLKQITDEVFFIPGVDRAGMQSMWTPNVRWREVTEEGFRGGAVIPDDYDGSPEALEKLRQNVDRSGQIGRLIANDFKSAAIIAPLTDTNPETGEKLDYREFATNLERLVRDKYQTDTVNVHITGFAKVVGDLIDGATLVASFFGVAFVITLVLLFLYSRCYWATIMPLVCSTTAVIWQLGLLRTFGYGLDPYSMLVPFLVFAIGISHSVQIVNNVATRFAVVPDALAACRATFRVLFVPGMIALISDGIGFLTLMVINIPVIQELALTAGIGVAVIIFTNLFLLPVLLSYTGISQGGVAHMRKRQAEESKVWRHFVGFVRPRWAMTSIAVAIVLGIGGVYFSKDLRIGDLDPGAPELRPDSRYNRDNAFLTENFSTSTDVFVVMVQTPTQQCGNYETLAAVDRFQEVMRDTEGVQSVASLVNVSKLVIMAMNEGNPLWHSLSPNQYILNNSLSQVPSTLMNVDCSMVPVLLFLNDHKAETLQSVVADAEAFAAEHSTDAVRFVLAGGNSGIEAATNEVIAKAQYQML
ncbi:MAG: MMPL family transporter, partial [Gammaproteobacteria bacterium]|nr:MMPL family transporter [Gammaproteobacteria bacterium]